MLGRISAQKTLFIPIAPIYLLCIRRGRFVRGRLTCMRYIHTTRLSIGKKVCC